MDENFFTNFFLVQFLLFPSFHAFFFFSFVHFNAAFFSFALFLFQSFTIFIFFPSEFLTIFFFLSSLYYFFILFLFLPPYEINFISPPTSSFLLYFKFSMPVSATCLLSQRNNPFFTFFSSGKNKQNVKHLRWNPLIFSHLMFLHHSDLFTSLNVQNKSIQLLHLLSKIS